MVLRSEREAGWTQNCCVCVCGLRTALCVCVCVCVHPGGLRTDVCVCVCVCVDCRVCARAFAHLHLCTGFSSQPSLMISTLPHPSLGTPSRFVQIPTHICESPGLQIKGEHS